MRATIVYFILRYLALILSKIFFQLEIYGKKNIPKKGGFILASNHVSFLDPIILAAACFRRLNFMTKEELFKNRFFAWLIRNAGAFPLVRNYGDSRAIKEGIRRLRKGNALLLFPEGTRSQDGSIKKPLSGVGFLAQKAHIPIIPTYVFGTNHAWSKGAKLVRSTKVKVYFGKPIFSQGEQTYDEIAAYVMQQIKHLHATNT